MEEKKKKPVWQKILMVILGLILLLAIVFGIFYFVGQSKLNKNIAEDEENSASVLSEQIVNYKGKKYKYNEDIINILFMGVDRDGALEKQEVLGQSGQADAILLFSLNEKTGEYNMFSIPRDTMADVKVYSGNADTGYVGTQKLQVCLAYGYGDGMEVSSENTVRAVSGIMYGLPINAYVAVSMGALPILNDMIGGVDVVIPEEYTKYDNTVTAGQTVTLMGDQVEKFVRVRNADTGDENDSLVRLERQKQYMINFINKALAATKANVTLPLSMYNQTSDYVCTNIGTAQITYLATCLLKNGMSANQIVSVPGSMAMGEHAEYTPDAEKLMELIINTYYVPVE